VLDPLGAAMASSSTCDRTPNFGRMDLAARVGWLPALDDILHPDGNAGFDALMRQNVEPVIFYGAHGRGGNVRGRQFTRFDRLTNALRIFLRFGVGLDNDAGRLRSAVDIPVSTNAGHSTDTPIGWFSARSS